MQAFHLLSLDGYHKHSSAQLLAAPAAPPAWNTLLHLISEAWVLLNDIYYMP
jgi:hypothetical protein